MIGSIPKFLAVDFYCGAGGTTRGLLDAGGYVICGIDKDPGNRETYLWNNKNTALDGKTPRFLCLDMFPKQPDYPDGQQDKVRDRLNELIPYYRRLAPKMPMLFVVCAPCQSFTRFVQRRLTTTRSADRDRELNLLSQTISFICEFEPEMIISENVSSIKTGPYRHIWNDYEEQLRALGYHVGEGSVCASRFGVPQYRRRSVLLALRKTKAGEPATVLPLPPEDPSSQGITAEEAIGHLPSLQPGGKSTDIANHICRDLTEVNRQRLMSVSPGEPNSGLSATPYGDLSLACHSRMIASGTRGFSDVYTRMHSDRPAPTLTTRFHSVSNGRFGHYDVNQVRGLSLREGALLQSFREDYRFFGQSMDAIARMIGNAVPPKLSKYLADWLLGLWHELSARETDLNYAERLLTSKVPS